MRIYENGIYRDMTHDELVAMQSEAARAEAQERTRPLTESEVSRLLIAQQPHRGRPDGGSDDGVLSGVGLRSVLHSRL